LAAEEAASVEDEAQAAAEAVAEAETQAAAEKLAAEEAATAEAEAQAAAAAVAKTETQAAAEKLAAEEAAMVEAEAQAAAEAVAEAVAEAETQAAAEKLAAEQAAAAEAEAAAQAIEVEAPEVVALVDPTVSEEVEAPVAATPQTATAPEEVVEETLDAQSVRTSAQDFATAIGGAVTRDEQRSGLSNIEKALLLGLGAVVVGSVLRNGDRVVANTGDRVVVEGDQGFTVYKDDDALLRQPGARMRTETFTDGSSRTTLDRADGSQVVTIRDSRGRVLRRAAVYPDGTQYELFDDLQPVAAVDVRQLQATRPVPRSLSVADNDLASLRAALREEMVFDAGRTFSLRQIREIEQVRSLVPAIELDTVTFATGSAAIPAVQARSLVRLGILIEELLLESPREMFLIEGHTDAVGSESYNLALSDRRAESVALALTEAFRIPPENLIVQGYGESFLSLQTQAEEERNRRVTVRRITPLLRQIAAN
jgi:outer membrane protein OmpA-like peptidoglycan-associated protein